MSGLKRTCLGFSEKEIEDICSVYDGRSETIDALQKRWPEHPRWHFTRVARRFGVATSGPPRWTEQDESFLVINRCSLSPKQIAGSLGRSELAVRLKLKRLGYKWIKGVEGFFTARATARIFGVDSKTVAWWIDNGWLEGDRFPIGYGPYLVRRISYDAIRNFIEKGQYWHLWDPQRMKPGSLKEWAGEVRNGRGRFVTTGELSRITYWSVGWIGKLIRRGIIKAIRYGANWKIPQEEADRFLREYCREGVSL